MSDATALHVIVRASPPSTSPRSSVSPVPLVLSATKGGVIIHAQCIEKGLKKLERKFVHVAAPPAAEAERRREGLQERG